MSIMPGVEKPVPRLEVVKKGEGTSWLVKIVLIAQQKASEKVEQKAHRGGDGKRMHTSSLAWIQ